MLKEMEKALGENKTLEELTLRDSNPEMYEDDDGTLHKEFCRHLVYGIQLNTSLSEVYLIFLPNNWDCPVDIGWYMSVTCCMTHLDVVYSV